MSVEKKISVIMPVYNSLLFLEKAVDSILKQSFENYELIIIDDGSTDGSYEFLLTKYKDARIRLFKNSENKGIIYTLNKGLGLAEGDYIARMDSDDICLPNRLEIQNDFLDVNLNVTLVGMWAKTLENDKGNFIGFSKLLNPCISHDDITFSHIFECRFIHPTVMFRRDLIDAGFRYSESAVHAEDFDLWVRASEFYKLQNIPIVGLKYRVHNQSVSNKNSQEQIRNSIPTRLKALNMITKDVVYHDLLSGIALNEFNNTFDFFKANSGLFDYLREVNRDLSDYYEWRNFCRNATFGPKLFKLFLSRHNNVSLFKKMILLGLCLLRRSR